MHPTKIPYLDFAWNPGGFGCSKFAGGTCPTCWSHRQATADGPTRPKCERCRNFEVHFHSERLDQPARRKRPAVIGVQFLGDLFDAARPITECLAVLEAMSRAEWHTYVMLSQQPQRAAMVLERFYQAPCPTCQGHGDLAGASEIDRPPCPTCRGSGDRGLPRNWFIGTTVRSNLPEEHAKLDALLTINGRLWISAEPLWGVTHLARAIGRVEGIVIGSDNSPAAPFAIDAATNAADQFRNHAAVWVKQLWLYACPNCDRVVGDFADLGHDCTCGTSITRFRRTLVTDAGEFPEELRLRRLPWHMATKDDQTGKPIERSRA